jgi:hypothetical protein
MRPSPPEAQELFLHGDFLAADSNRIKFLCKQIIIRKALAFESFFGSIPFLI